LKTKKIKIPNHLEHLHNKTIKHYLEAPESVQRLVRMTDSIQGRYGKYVFQLSRGTQQIKLYEPHKYKNDRNTPLRIRTRKIVKLAWQNPEPNIDERLRYLFRNYPYYLLKSEPVKLRMKNFYFDRAVRDNDLIRIYRANDPQNPDPDTDHLYVEKKYAPKKEILFQYEDRDEEYYYVVNQRNGDISNVLRFVWQEEIVHEEFKG